jgi:hypothetical protein
VLGTPSDTYPFLDDHRAVTVLCDDGQVVGCCDMVVNALALNTVSLGQHFELPALMNGVYSLLQLRNAGF